MCRQHWLDPVYLFNHLPQSKRLELHPLVPIYSFLMQLDSSKALAGTGQVQTRSKPPHESLPLRERVLDRASSFRNHKKTITDLRMECRAVFSCHPLHLSQGQIARKDAQGKQTFYCRALPPEARRVFIPHQQPDCLIRCEARQAPSSLSTTHEEARKNRLKYG